MRKSRVLPGMKLFAVAPTPPIFRCAWDFSTDLLFLFRAMPICRKFTGNTGNLGTDV